jgi:hypothetical protein
LGAVIAIIGATAGTTTGIWRLCDSWRGAPAALHGLRDELARTQEFWGLVRRGVENADGGGLLDRGAREVTEGAPSGLNTWSVEESTAGLVKLLRRGQAILVEIDIIIAQVSEGRLSSSQPDVDEKDPGAKPLSARRRLTWIIKSSQVRKLKRALSRNNDIIYGKLLAMNVYESSAPITGNLDG